VFPVYFRLSLPSGAVGRAEIMSLIDSVANPVEFKERLLAARTQKRPDGIAKARELLERLMDHVEKDIPDARVATTIGALVDVGDDLVEPREQRAMFDPGSDMRVARPVYHLLKRVQREQRREVLERAIRGAHGLVISATLLRSLDREATRNDQGIEPPLLSAEEVKFLQQVWVERARVLFESVTGHTDFRWILEAWRGWGDPAELRARCERFVADVTGLLVFLHAFVQHLQIATSRSVQRRPRLDPAWLEPFINVEAAAARLAALLERGEVPEAFDVDVRQFLKEKEMRAAGKDPNALGWPDDDE
jgi:predicted KAP-like P-loop ATPase